MAYTIHPNRHTSAQSSRYFPQYGLITFVSQYQDVWSRYASRFGEPVWTLEHVSPDLGVREESSTSWPRSMLLRSGRVRIMAIRVS